MLTNPEFKDLIAVEANEVDLLIEAMEYLHHTKWFEAMAIKKRHRFFRMYEQLLTHKETLKETK